MNTLYMPAKNPFFELGKSFSIESLANEKSFEGQLLRQRLNHNSLHHLFLTLYLALFYSV